MYGMGCLCTVYVCPSCSSDHQLGRLKGCPTAVMLVQAGMNGMGSPMACVCVCVLYGSGSGKALNCQDFLDGPLMFRLRLTKCLCV